MRKSLLSIALFAIVSISYSQNVGVGTITPSAPLHIKSTTNSNPLIIDGAGPQTYSTIAESGLSIGYFGSFAGSANDVDFGTGFGNNGNLHLTTLAIPRLSIDNTGKTGIGTTTPNHQLHVSGGDVFVHTSFGAFRFGFDGSNQWRFPTINGGADFMMATSTNGTLFTNTHYFAQNGDVGIGIGTSTPIARLDIKTTSTSSATSAMMVRNSNNDTLVRVRNNGYIGIGYNGASYGRPLNIEGPGINFYHNAATFGGAIFPDVNNNLVLWSQSGSDDNVVLQPSWGGVTIGTYTAATGYKLSVRGKIMCEEARVQLNASWPDYVFNNDYNLMPLEELEQIIKNQKHLPNIPTAAQVEKEGFDLGGMNIKLLEKVEELTLYVIELNKKYNELKENNRQLTEKVNQLQPGKQ